MGGSSPSPSSSEQQQQSEPASSSSTTTMAARREPPSPPTSTKKGPRVWAVPFVIAGVFFFIFLLFWMYYAILQRYWIKNNWNDSLPGLDTTPWHKFTMRTHMTTGAMGMLLGPIQFVPYIRKNHRVIHRWTGRLYCMCGMLACFFGLWFIALKRRLVGGYNMSVAFAFAGLAIGLSSFQLWKTARKAKSGVSHNFQAHRNWAIRSYAQMVAPALYRYWYIFMEIFGLYRTPIPLRNGGYCDENNYCPDYGRLLDAAYCWIYWISAGIVAEIIIYNLPEIGPKEQQIYVSPLLPDDDDDDSDEVNPTTDASSSGNTMTAPLLSSNGDDQHSNDNTTNIGNGTTRNSSQDASKSYGSNNGTVAAAHQQEQGDDPSVVANDAKGHASAKIVNAIGIMLSAATITVTLGTFYLIFKN